MTLHEITSIRRNALLTAATLLLMGIGAICSCQASDFKLAGSCVVLDYDTPSAGKLPVVTSYQWSGGCDEGGFATGSGELKAYWNQELDEVTQGTMVHGRLTGMAITTAPNGYTFRGRYRDGVRDGKGVLSSSYVGGELAYHYAGQFHGGQPNGHGTLDAGGRHFEGEFLNGKLYGIGIESGSRSFGTHYSYEGQFRANRWWGHGILTWSRGDRYEGDFVDGKCEGQGTWTWANGMRYHGMFTAGLPNGHGFVTMPDGHVFEDMFVAGQSMHAPTLSVDTRLATFLP